MPPRTRNDRKVDLEDEPTLDGLCPTTDADAAANIRGTALGFTVADRSLHNVTLTIKTQIYA